MKQPLISVIVPVYKVEKYLSRCVDSILSQTYENLEIILVDDGSPDGCPQICDEYAKKDSRIKVIHKENGGVSSARNAGLDEATGSYVMFVDSDDVITKKAISCLYGEIVETNSTLAIGGITQVYPFDSIKEDGEKVEYSNMKEALNSLIRGQIFSGCYAKLLDIRLAKSNRFDSMYKIAEDYYYLFGVLRGSKGKAVKFTTPNIYKRIIREDGAIKNKTYFRGLRDVFRVNERILEEISGADEQLRESALYRFRYDAYNISLIFASSRKRDKEEAAFLKSELKKYNKELKRVGGFSWKEHVIWTMMSAGVWHVVYVLQKIRSLTKA